LVAAIALAHFFGHTFSQQSIAHGKGTFFRQLGIDGDTARAVMEAADHQHLACLGGGYSLSQRLFGASSQISLAHGKVEAHHAINHFHVHPIRGSNGRHGWRNRCGGCIRNRHCHWRHWHGLAFQCRSHLLSHGCGRHRS